MPTYKAELPSGLPGLSLKNGTNVLLVEAVDATDAATLVQGHAVAQDDALWANATISELTVGTDFSPVYNPDTGVTNEWVFTVTVAGADTNASWSHTAVAGEDLDDVMAAMVILIDAHADIAASDWSTPLLTVAEIADDIGDHTMTCTVTYGGVDIAGQTGAIVHEGIAGAVLTQTYSTLVPTIAHMSAS